MKEIKEVLLNTYVEKKPNSVRKEDITIFTGNIVRNFIVTLEDLHIKVTMAQDKEYSLFEYGKHCLVATDIELSKNKCKYTMVIQISKLGKYAKIYWKKRAIFGGVAFRYDIPKEWNREFMQVKEVFRNSNARFLTEEELHEEIKEIKHIFNPKQNARVDDLLFCFDGPH
ncbi:MAG: hypothetical protein ABH843_08545 [Candidatus Omnitrophota bacterium]